MDGQAKGAVNCVRCAGKRNVRKHGGSFGEVMRFDALASRLDATPEGVVAKEKGAPNAR